MPDWPKKIPDKQKDFDRAVCLLGNRTKGNIKYCAMADLESHSTTKTVETPKVELQKLIGIYPTPAQAAAWKQALKRIRKEKSPVID